MKGSLRRYCKPSFLYLSDMGLWYYMGGKSPRRRKLLGKQKILYSDMNTPIKDCKINPVEKQQFLDEFRLKKEQEKRQRLILLIVISGVIGISLLFLTSPN